MAHQRMFINVGFEKYLIPNDQDTAHRFVDFNWRDFIVNQPIILSYKDNKTGNSKTMNVNYMSGVLDAVQYLV